MILSGTIIFAINNNSFFYEATQGERYKIFIIPPYVPHSIQAISRYIMVSICIDKKIINMISHTQLRADVINLLSRTINLDIEKQDEVMQCLNELISYHNNLCAPKTIFIDNLRKQLEEFPEQKFSVQAMAQAAFISKYQFIRNFKKEIGLTPHQFQLQNRILKAKRLLREKENMTEVAMDVGFCDQSHFIKQFKKNVGLTPLSYKMCCNVI